MECPTAVIPEDGVLSKLCQIAGEIVENQIPEFHFLRSWSGWSDWPKSSVQLQGPPR